jgi:hypothetical protein
MPTATPCLAAFRQASGPALLSLYAAEKLREAGEEPMLRHQHLEWFALLAEQAEECVGSADRQVWLDRLKAESNNLRAALAWSEQASTDPHCTSAAVTAGLRLGALWHLWNLPGTSSEARTRVLALLSTGKGDRAFGRKPCMRYAPRIHRCVPNTNAGDLRCRHSCRRASPQTRSGVGVGVRRSTSARPLRMRGPATTRRVGVLQTRGVVRHHPTASEG